MLTAGQITDQINQITDIVEIVQPFIGSFRKQGQNWIGLCPFHADKKPSFFVNSAKNIYKCFSCQEGGNIIKFIEKIKHCDRTAAINYIAEITNHPEWKINQQSLLSPLAQKLYALNNIIAQRCSSMLQTYFQTYASAPEKLNSLLKTNIEYLIKRKINFDLIQYFQLGCDPTQNHELSWNEYLKQCYPQYDKEDFLIAGLFTNQNQFVFNTRLLIPIQKEFGICGFSGRSFQNEEPKYLNTAENAIFHKNNLLFNFVNASKQNFQESLFIVEGYFDVFALYHLKCLKAVATMGTNISSMHLQQISKITNQVILILDNDKAGREAGWRWAAAIIKIGIKVNFFIPPAPFKDLAEMYQANLQNLPEQLFAAPDYLKYHLQSQFKNQSIETFLTTAKKLIWAFANQKDTIQDYWNYLASLVDMPLSKLNIKYSQPLFQSKIQTNQTPMVFKPKTTIFVSQSLTDDEDKIINTLIDLCSYIKVNIQHFTQNDLNKYSLTNQFIKNSELVKQYKMIDFFHLLIPTLFNNELLDETLNQLSPQFQTRLQVLKKSSTPLVNENNLFQETEHFKYYQQYAQQWLMLTLNQINLIIEQNHSETVSNSELLLLRENLQQALRRLLPNN